MQLKVVATGSRGNCYVLSHEGKKIVIDAGVKYKDLQKAIDFEPDSVSGVLVGHEHHDHAAAVPDLLANGYNVWMSQGTMNMVFDEDDYLREMLNIIKAREVVHVSPWQVQAFTLEHDAEEPLGFVINLGSKYRVLYATDTSHIAYTFTGLTHIIIECNYCLTTINENLEAGKINRTLKNRILATHMGLETLLPWLKMLALETVETIFLVHMSSMNGNAALIKSAVEHATGVNVVVAEPGCVYDMDKLNVDF